MSYSVPHQARVIYSYKLRVTMQLGNEEIRYAEYASFWVEDEARLYRLHVDGYNGTAGRCDV